MPHFGEKAGHILTNIINSENHEFLPTFANIQAAIDDLPAAGGKVWLPPMNVSGGSVAARITSSNIKLIGSGESTAITITANNINAIEVAGTAPAKLTGITIAQLRLEGTGEGTGSGIYADYVDESVFDQIKAHNFGGYGILLDHDCDYNLISKGRFFENVLSGIRVLQGTCEVNAAIGNKCNDNGQMGIQCGGVHMLVVGNHCEMNLYGIQGSTDGCIVGNDCQYNYIHGIGAPGYGMCTGNICARNGSYRTGVAPGGYGIVVQADFAAVTGNECNHQYSGATRDGAGILVKDAAYCTISGNQCEENDLQDGVGDGIRLEGDSDENIVNGNNCHLNGRDGIRVAAATCNNSMITNNKLVANGTPLTDAGTGTLENNNEGNVGHYQTTAQAWAAYAGPTGVPTNGTRVIVYSSGEPGHRLYCYSNGAWHYVNLT